MARQRRVPAAVPLVVAALVVGISFVVVASIGGDGADPGSAVASTTTTSTTSTTTTEPPPDPIDAARLEVASFAEDAPTAYRIDYDVLENGEPRTETLVVRRPYESLQTSARDGDLLSGTATSRTALRTYVDHRDGWIVLQPELHRAAFDLRPLQAMAVLVELGLAEEGEPGEIAGRPCRRFVTGDPPGNAVVTPPSPAQTTELCLDASGLMLRERWSLDGDVVVDRTATSVVVDPPLDPTTFDPEPAATDAGDFDAITSMIAVEADAETLARLRTEIVLPDGFVADGAVLRGTVTGTGGAPSATEIVRFHSRGAELVEHVEVIAPAEAELSTDGAYPVRLQGLEEVWFVPSMRASALRIRLSETSFVELRGTDPALLVELARSLTAETDPPDR